MADMRDHPSDQALHEPARPAETLAVLFADALSARPLERSFDLRGLVECEVVPRLNRGAASTALCIAAGRADLDLTPEAAALAELLLADNRAAVCERIDILRESEGCSLERIFLELLAPTAGHLRLLWVDDHCGLAEVTLAICNLQAIVRHLAPAFRAEWRATHPGSHEGERRAILVSPRVSLDVGATAFGLAMLAEFFRRSGWEPWVEADLAAPTLRTALADHWFDIAEVLVQDGNKLDAVAAGIRSIRRSSLNRSIGVIVCGRISTDRHDLARLVGADLASSDPRSSLIQAHQLVTLAASPARPR